MNLKSKKGFTLVELIIVIAILGIIALIAVPSLTGVQKRSQVNADIRTAEQIGKAVRVWLTDGNINETRAREAYIEGQYLELSAMDTDTVTDADTQPNAKEGLEDYISLTYEPNLADYNFYVGMMNNKVVVGIGSSAPLATAGSETTDIYEYADTMVVPAIAYVEGISSLTEDNVTTAFGIEESGT